jgi:hypothetical protein
VVVLASPQLVVQALFPYQPGALDNPANRDCASGVNARATPTGSGPPTTNQETS